MNPKPQVIPRDDPRYPARLRQRLGTEAPPELTALGTLELLSKPMTALFCSARCPGNQRASKTVQTPPATFRACPIPGHARGPSVA